MIAYNGETLFMTSMLTKRQLMIGTPREKTVMP